jgi:hypothetical protein
MPMSRVDFFPLVIRLKMFFDRFIVSLPDGDGLFSFEPRRLQKLISKRLIKLSTRFGFDGFVKVPVFKFSDS